MDPARSRMRRARSGAAPTRLAEPRASPPFQTGHADRREVVVSSHLGTCPWVTSAHVFRIRAARLHALGHAAVDGIAARMDPSGGREVGTA